MTTYEIPICRVERFIETSTHLHHFPVIFGVIGTNPQVHEEPDKNLGVLIVEKPYRTRTYVYTVKVL